MKSLASTTPIFRLLAFTLMALIPFAPQAREWLVNSHSQLLTNPKNDGSTADGPSDVALIGLTDGDPEKDSGVEDGGGVAHNPWQSVDLNEDDDDAANGYANDKRNYLQINLASPLTLEADESIVVYLKRHTLHARCHPTTMQMLVSRDGEKWVPAAYAFFVYRGINATRDYNNAGSTNGTKEYSSRIKFDEQTIAEVGEINHIRLVCTANNTKSKVRKDPSGDFSQANLTHNRRMILASMNIMKLKDDENYSLIRKDRFHLVLDYSYKYYYHRFIPTLGVFEPRNRPTQIPYISGPKDAFTGYAVFPDENPGESPWKTATFANDKGYVWGEDTKFLQMIGLEMPIYRPWRYEDFEDKSRKDPISTNRYIAKDTPFVVNMKDGEKVADTNVGNWRQPAHIVEHEIYAVQGDAVALYPYFDLPLLDDKYPKEANKYYEDMTHWYNYRTGGNVTDETGTVDYLDFLINPLLVCKSKEFGYYGGVKVSAYTKRASDPQGGGESGGETGGETDDSYKIGTAEAFIEFANAVNNGNTFENKRVVLTDDISFKDVTPVTVGNDQNKPFKGTFDGQGHTISNFVMENPEKDYVGIFGYLGYNSVISNIVFDSSCKLSGKDYVAPISYYMSGNQNFVPLKNVVSYATVTSNGECSGGIIAYTVPKELVFENCVFAGNITGKSKTAVFGFYNDFGPTLKNCICTGTVSDGEPSTSIIIDAAGINVWQKLYARDSYFYIPEALTADIELRDKIPSYNFSSLSKDVDGKYYLDNDGVKIYVDSQEFANLLNAGNSDGVWILKNGMLQPFREFFPSTDPGTGGDDTSTGEGPVEVGKDLDIIGADYDRINAASMLEEGTPQETTSIAGKFNKGNTKIGTGYRYFGTVATFFVPRNTSARNNGKANPLPVDPTDPAGKNEYIIACDIFNIVDNNKDQNGNIINANGGGNFDDKNHKIYEPTVTIRHLFKIKDGIEFAEKFSGSAEANKSYVRSLRKVITAPVDKPFQYRLAYPIPKDYRALQFEEIHDPSDYSIFEIKESYSEPTQFSPPSNYYYKISDEDYRRVRSCEIEVYEYDGQNMTKITNRGSDYNQLFHFDNVAKFDGEGKRNFESTDYTFCGGFGEYNTMLKCDPTLLNNAKGNKRYLVRLIGLDINSERIKVFGSDEDLIVEEFDISFLEKDKAWTSTYDTKVEKYIRDNEGNQKQLTALEYDKLLEAFHGKPSATVNFDEYMYLAIPGDGVASGVKDPSKYFIKTNGDVNGDSYFKYPFSWEQSSYGYGYAHDPIYSDHKAMHHDLYNYNIYLIANSSNVVPYGGAGSYDITHLKTGGSQKGFFYYVNSAADPGVAARLRINKLCFGSTIRVSAWLKELSGTTFGNMNFNFVAVMPDGERVILNTHTSGESTQEWTNVYFEFIPDYEALKQILENSGFSEPDHYEVELDNNCNSSSGADYITDEIRIFVKQPEVRVKQMEYICDKETASVPVKVSIPFDQALAMLDKYVADDAHTLHYTFIDSELFYKELAKGSYNNAFNAAVLKYDYRQNGQDDGTFGVITFNKVFENNPGFPENGEAALNTAYSETVTTEIGDNGTSADTEKLLTFITKPTKNPLIPGHKYIIALIPDFFGEADPGADDFEVTDQCSKAVEFTLESANEVLVKTDDNEPLTLEGTYCLGASPEIDIRLRGYDSDGNVYDIDKDAYFDWYAGTMKQFDNETMPAADGGEAMPLSEVLARLRAITEPQFGLSDKKDGDGNTMTDETGKTLFDTDLEALATDGSFTGAMKKYLQELTTSHTKDGRRKLVLSQQKYKFASLFATANDSVNVVVAVPIDRNYDENHNAWEGVTGKDLSEEELTNLKLCVTPIEVRLKVSSNSPGMFHGFDLDYPSDIVDVPIRIGLRQIQKTWGHDYAADGMKTDRSMTLRIPIKKVNAPTTGASGLSIRRILAGNAEVEGYPSDIIGEPVMLIETSDPRYSDGFRLDGETHFPEIGTVVDIRADKVDNGNENAFYVRFDGLLRDEKGNPLRRRYFNFQEGHFYTMSFAISETSEIEGFSTTACPGQHIFTIKVVPEYVMWNGDTPDASGVAADGVRSLNWNNDKNWKRVAPDDLFPDSKTGEISGGVTVTTAKKLPGYGTAEEAKGTAIYDYSPTAAGADPNETDKDAPNLLDKFTTGGTNEYYSNSGENAFTPMEFTKVIIGNGAEFPRLYQVTDTRVENADLPDIHTWSKLPDAPEAAGLPTANIHYDMVAYTENIPEKYGNIAVSVRPWYANTSEQIHFLPNSEISGQQHLRYRKAWVEMEMDNDKWYTASSPLNRVYAGDMYLPTAGARQVSPLFEGIRFKHSYQSDGSLAPDSEGTVTNHRFRPAVYQRSWNLASDIIWEKDGSSRDGVRAIDWSDVYNDVTVGYAPGEGFSIKTDVSDATIAEGQDKVLFRFPKEDEEYTYYDHADETGKKANDPVYKTRDAQNTPIAGHGRLHDVATPFTVTVNANGSSRFFLAGNPFMSHLDMQKFIGANDNIEPSFWILNSDRQSVTIIDADAVAVASDGNARTLLPPMAGFFVKSKSSVKELTLIFDETMADVVAADPSASWLSPDDQDITTRSGDEGSDGTLRITAVRNGIRRSAALIRRGAQFDAGYKADEDAETLLDPSLEAEATVYTVAGGNALSINSTPTAEGTEIGLITDNDEETTLLFEGVEANAGYFLLDTATGETCEVYDGMAYRFKGEAKNRLFLSGGLPDTPSAGISIIVEKDTATVMSNAGLPIDVQVSDVAGRVIKQFSGETSPVVFRLTEGVAIINASDGISKAVSKIIF